MSLTLSPERFSLAMEKRPGPEDKVGPSFKTSTFLAWKSYQNGY